MTQAMKPTENHNIVEFGSLKYGDIFVLPNKDDDHIYMKVALWGGETQYVNLSTGHGYFCSEKTQVIKVGAGITHSKNLL